MPAACGAPCGDPWRNTGQALGRYCTGHSLPRRWFQVVAEMTNVVMESMTCEDEYTKRTRRWSTLEKRWNACEQLSQLPTDYDTPGSPSTMRPHSKRSEGRATVHL